MAPPQQGTSLESLFTASLSSLGGPKESKPPPKPMNAMSREAKAKATGNKQDAGFEGLFGDAMAGMKTQRQTATAMDAPTPDFGATVKAASPPNAQSATATLGGLGFGPPPVAVPNDDIFGLAPQPPADPFGDFPAAPPSAGSAEGISNVQSSGSLLDDQADALLAFASGVPAAAPEPQAQPQPQPAEPVSTYTSVGGGDDDEWHFASAEPPPPPPPPRSPVAVEQPPPRPLPPQPTLEDQPPEPSGPPSGGAGANMLDAAMDAANAARDAAKGMFKTLKKKAAKLSGRVHPKDKGDNAVNELSAADATNPNTDFDALAFSDSDGEPEAGPEWQGGAGPADKPPQPPAPRPPPQQSPAVSAPDDNLLGSFEGTATATPAPAPTATPDDLDIFASPVPAAPQAAAADTMTELERMMAGDPAPAASAAMANSGFDDLFGGPPPPPAAVHAGGPMMGFGDAMPDAGASVMLSEQGEEGEPEERRIAREKRLARWQAQMQEKLAEKMERDQAELFEREERQEAKAKHGAGLDEWGKRNTGNIRALLGSVGTVLWEGNNWKDINMMDLVEPAQVKKGYRMAMLKIHPDKVKQRGGTSEQMYIADFVFDLLKEAYAKFEDRELRGNGGGSGPVHL